MKRICEFCKKEYDWEEGQENYTKIGLGRGKGSVRSDRFCSWICGQNFAKLKRNNTNIVKYSDVNYNNREQFKKTIAKYIEVDADYYTKNDLKSKETRRQKYNNPNYNNKERSEQTRLERYGVKNFFGNKEILKKAWEHHKNTLSDPKRCKEIKEKSVKTWKSTTNSNKLKDSLYQQKINTKVYNTKKLHNSFSVSKSEEEIYLKLIEKFGEENTHRQYKSEKYPFACDFYILSLDLYIEYQGNWTHGKEPYNENNKDHLNLIEMWKNKAEEINFKGSKKNYYNIAITVWTKSDPLKRQIAKENDLNWIEFFNLEEFYAWYNNIL